LQPAVKPDKTYPGPCPEQICGLRVSARRVLDGIVAYLYHKKQQLLVRQLLFYFLTSIAEPEADYAEISGGR
jgi:hypothetical protein